MSSQRSDTWETTCHVKFLGSDEFISNGLKNEGWEPLEGFPSWLQGVESNSVRGNWFPWCPIGEESTCRWRRCGFDPWVQKIPWRRKWQPNPVFSPGESHGQRSLAGCSPWGHKRVGHDLDTEHQLQGKEQKIKQHLKTSQFQEGELRSSNIECDFLPAGNWVPHSCGRIKASK